MNETSVKNFIQPCPEASGLVTFLFQDKKVRTIARLYSDINFRLLFMFV